MSAVTVARTADSPVRFATHKIGAKLLFDDAGLSPYYGLVSTFEPDHDESLGTFESVGQDWQVTSSTYWQGKLADPDGSLDGGMYEYSYQLRAEDDVGDRDVTLQFRPAFQEARHVDTGESIGLPEDMPRGIRLQVESVNLERQQLLPLLQDFASVIGLNPGYFSQPHEWSRIYALETYARINRTAMEKSVTAEGGILHDIANFASTGDGRGEYKWDHEDVQGHYEAVGLDVDTWSMFLEGQQYGKRVKSYHPEHVRDENTEDDPLSHPKFEVQYSPDYDGIGSVAWSDYDQLREELETTGLNVLHWAGLPVEAEEGSDTYVEDPYFSPQAGFDTVEVTSNPIPEVHEKVQDHAAAELADASLGDSEKDVLLALTDGGRRHYDDLADEAGASSSTIYRLVDKLRSLRADNGIIEFADGVTRDHIDNILGRVRDVADWAAGSVQQAIQEASELRKPENSVFADWMERHGITLIEQYPDLHFDLGGHLTNRDVVEILRAGFQAAERSAIRTERFLEAIVSYQTPDGEGRRRYPVAVARGGRYDAIGVAPIDA